MKEKEVQKVNFIIPIVHIHSIQTPLGENRHKAHSLLFTTIPFLCIHFTQQNTPSLPLRSNSNPPLSQYNTPRPHTPTLPPSHTLKFQPPTQTLHPHPHPTSTSTYLPTLLYQNQPPTHLIPQTPQKKCATPQPSSTAATAS